MHQVRFYCTDIFVTSVIEMELTFSLFR